MIKNGHITDIEAAQSYVQLLEKGYFDLAHRPTVGDKLAQLGDPRPGVGVQQINGNAVPSLRFSFIPAGPFWLGDESENDAPQHLYDLTYHYWLSCYPVTVAHLRQFETEIGQSVRTAYPLEIDLSANCPVVGFASYYIDKFCQHYTKRGHTEGWLHESLAITIPSEAEWEKAMRGGLQIPEKLAKKNLGEIDEKTPHYTLMDNPDPRRKHTWEHSAAIASLSPMEIFKISELASIGLFDEYVSCYGIADVNLEITRTIWGMKGQKPKYTYPYVHDDGREKFGDLGMRVIRGEVKRPGQPIRCSYRQPLAKFSIYRLRVAIVPYSILQ